MPDCKTVDHEEVQLLLGEIDNTDNRLSRGEIDFVAGLIDERVIEFSPAQSKRVRSIHKNRVVNGKPDND